MALASQLVWMSIPMPLKHGQVHMKRKRERQQEQRCKEQVKNTSSTQAGSVDDYACVRMLQGE